MNYTTSDAMAEAYKDFHEHYNNDYLAQIKRENERLREENKEYCRIEQQLREELDKINSKLK